jgi:hypothetical protein
MPTAADGKVPSPSSDRNDGHHPVVSELVSLIENIRAGMKLLEAAIDRETAPATRMLPATFSFWMTSPPLREGERHAERLQCQP